MISLFSFAAAVWALLRSVCHWIDFGPGPANAASEARVENAASTKIRLEIDDILFSPVNVRLVARDDVGTILPQWHGGQFHRFQMRRSNVSRQTGRVNSQLQMAKTGRVNSLLQMAKTGRVNSLLHMAKTRRVNSLLHMAKS